MIVMMRAIYIIGQGCQTHGPGMIINDPEEGKKNDWPVRDLNFTKNLYFFSVDTDGS